MRWLWGGWLAMGLLGPVASAQTETWVPAKTYALLVGVLEWQSDSLATFPKTNRQDRALQRALQAAGVPPSQIVFLEDQQATLAAIRRELMVLAGRAGPGSTLMFDYAGHGVREDHATYFANYDLGDDAARTGFGLTELASALKTHWKGDRRLLFADCCYSGGLSRVAETVGQQGIPAACLTSATASNLSTGNWTFTESLIQLFQGQGQLDGNRDGRLTFLEADRYIFQQMRDVEDQLTHGYRSAHFSDAFVFRPVDPLQPAQVQSAPPLRRAEWKGGDRVLVEWEGTWYPAVVQKEEDHDLFDVHDDGYGTAWDEWVPPSRIRPAKPRG